MSLVGIAGKAGSGKDEVAKVFYKHGYFETRFARPIKLMLRALLSYRGVDTDHITEMLDGALKEVPSRYLNGATPRYAMQTLGQEWGAMHIHPDLWTDIEFEINSAYLRVVCTDVRTPSEAARIKALGGTIVRVFRPGACSTSDPHVTEALAFKHDYALFNTGTIEDLRMRTAELIEEFERPRDS